MAWNIYKDVHGRHVTTQRPIIISVKDDLISDIVHFRCELLIHNGTGYTPTGVQFNAYSDSDSAIYECNVAEYCRQYITETESWFTGSWCGSNNNMYFRRFVVRFNPVILKTNGTLEVDYDNPKDSSQFYTYPINTKATESLSTQDDYIRIDYFVCDGSNASGISWFSSSYNRLQTNMPDGNAINVNSELGWVTMPFIVSPVPTHKLRVKVINTDNGTSFTIYMYTSSIKGTFPLNIHPTTLEMFYYFQNGGTYANVLLDSSGNLIASEMRLDLQWDDINTNVGQRGNPGKTYKLITERECGNNSSETFIFRNMVGGFDFFTATGTKSKGITIGGMTFDRHTAFNSLDKNFGVMRGQHASTNLWTERIETFSVFSQPLTTEMALWIEELIASPQAWVTKDIKGQFNGGWSGKCLQAIIIDKASFNIYNTEDNVHYIEFKYTLSENYTTMKM